MLVIICSYCQQILGYKEGGDGQTHGICSTCAEEQHRLLEEWLKEKESQNSKKID